MGVQAGRRFCRSWSRCCWSRSRPVSASRSGAATPVRARRSTCGAAAGGRRHLRSHRGARLLRSRCASNNRYLGFLLTIVYFVGMRALRRARLRPPPVPLRRRARRALLGHERLRPFVRPLVWFDLYWAVAAALLVVAAHLLWVRGRRRAGAPGCARRGGGSAARRGSRPPSRRWLSPRRGAGSSTTPTSSTSTCRTIWPATGRPATRRSTSSTRRLPQPRIRAMSRRRRHLSRAARGRHPRALPPAQRARGRRSTEVHVTHRSATSRSARSRSRARRRRSRTASSATTSSRLAAPLAPGEEREMRLRDRGAQPGLPQRRRGHQGGAQRHLLQQLRLLPARRLLRAPASCKIPTAAPRARPAAGRAHARARRRGGARAQLPHRRRPTGCDFETTVSHQRRPDRARARLSRARVDRGRAALLPLQDGRADPRLLRLPLGALGGGARPLERRRASRSTTTRATPTTWSA